MEEKNDNVVEPTVEPQEKPKPKCKMTEKKIEALKKARAALVRSRDKNRLNMHETAFDAMVDRKVTEKLEAFALAKQKKASSSSSDDSADTADTERTPVHVVRKKKPPRVVAIESSSSSDEPVYAKPPIHRSRAKPTPEATEAGYRQQMNDMLYRNVFGR